MSPLRPEASLQVSAGGNRAVFSPFPPVPQQSKRLSTPAIALRSKSMTSELEEMGKKLAWINFRVMKREEMQILKD